MRKSKWSLLVASVMMISLLAGCSTPNGSNATTGNATEAPTTATEAPTQAPADTATDAPEVTEPAASTGEANVLNVCIASQPETLDPNLNSSSDGGTYLQHAYEGLYRYNKEGKLELGLATEMTKSEDGLTLTYKLRPEAKWSDGQPVTAKDFVFSWKRLADPEVAAPYAGDMIPYILNGQEIVDGKKQPDELGVTAIDDNTLEVKLANPCTYIDQILGFPTFLPLREDVVTDKMGTWATKPTVYNGAFKITAWEPDSQIVMVPNDQYYDAASISQNTINFKLMEDGNAQVSAIRSGELDLMHSPPSDEIPKLTEEGYFSTSPLIGTYYVSFNVEAKPFDDPRVRKAFYLALDRKYIVENVTLCNEVPLTSFVGYGFTDADGKTDFRDVGGDPITGAGTETAYEEARKLLAEAGYPNGEGFPTVTWLYNTNEGHKRAGEAMQNMWKTVLNVNVELQNADWAVVQDLRRKGDYQFARGGWLGDYLNPLTMLSIFQSTSGNNDAQYKNPAFDKLVQDAMKAATPEEHYKILHEADKMLFDEAPIIPLYNYVQKTVKTPKLTGDLPVLLGYHFFHWATKAQ